jgi:hypothetical protein
MSKTYGHKFVIFGLGLMLAAPANAEPPMHVDDADVLGKGGMKIEGAWLRDDKTRGPELLFGFAPIDALEIGIAVSRASDRAQDPASRLTGTGIGLKWVPLQNETGWSLGLSFAFDRTRVDERATATKYTTHEAAFFALATYRFAHGQVTHLNLGAKRSMFPDERVTVGAWGAGYEHPLTEAIKLTAEIFGAEHARPDKAIGLRYTVFEGFKVSGALGRGNGRGFMQAGFAWEF